MMESLRVLYGRRYRVKSVVESRVQVVTLQAKLPERPSPTRFVHGVVVVVVVGFEDVKLSGVIKWGIKFEMNSVKKDEICRMVGS